MPYKEIVVKFNKEFCEYIAKSKTMCKLINEDYNLHLIYNILPDPEKLTNIRVSKITDSNNIEIINNKVITTALKWNYGLWNSREAVDQLYIDLNYWFFDNANGSLIENIIFLKKMEIRNEHIYRGPNNKTLLFEIMSNSGIITVIMDFSNIFNEIEKNKVIPEIFKPIIKICKCNIIKTLKDCKECLII